MAKLFKSQLIIALICVIICAPCRAAAASPVNLSTSPLPISLSAAPGTAVTTDIRIKNNGDTQPIKVSLMKFSAYGDSGQPALRDREPGDDYFDWVSFSPATFVATSGEWQTVKMTIRIPTDAGFGYYYAAVFTPLNTKPSGKGNVLLGSTAVLVLLDVQNPNAKRSLQIASFQADKHFYEFLPASFQVKLRNTGNVHLLPHGNIYIDRGSKQVANLVVNAQQGNILPGSNRIYTVAWPEGFPAYVDQQQGGRLVLDPKTGHPQRQLKWDWSKFSKLRFGHYTARLLMAYDNGQRDVPLEASVSFWVVPLRLLVAVLVIGLLAAIGLGSVGRNLIRKFRGKSRAK